MHEQATRARCLVAAGQPLKVPGGRYAGQAGAAPRPDLPSFVFAKELTKLLSNRNSCLKDHSNGVELQMRVARGDDSGGRPQGSVGGLAKATTILTKTTAAADPAPTKVTARARANSFILKQQQQQQWLCEQQQV